MLNALGLGYSETKIKPYLKMGVQRVQIANNKKLTSVKHQKKEVAALLSDKKDEKARIRVEHIIRDDFLIEAYEILELLCELLHERIKQISTGKECPVDLKETVFSLVWAASNCDVSELQEVKKQLIRKYGSEFFKVLEEDPSQVVNTRLFNKLSYQPPGRLLVNRYLMEIADVYKVDWIPPVECEAVDEEAPYSTPTGFSINMAPGSGLTSAYTSAPTATPLPSPLGGTTTDTTSAKQATAPLPTQDGTRKLNAAEQEEYEQFRRHQSTTTGLTLSPAEPVYPAVYGPPPHLRNSSSAPAAESMATTTPLTTTTTSISQHPSVVGVSAVNNLHSATSAPAAMDKLDTYPVDPVLLSTGPAAESNTKHDVAPMTLRESFDEGDGDDGGDQGGSDGAVSAVRPPPPPPAAPTPSASEEDPMQSMLARLAALQH